MLDLESLSLHELQQLERDIKMRKRELLVNEQLRENEDLLEEYLQNYDSPCTRRMYKTAVKKFIVFMMGKNLQFTTKLDLERYFEELNESSYRIKTKRTYLEGVKSFFKYFLHRQGIDPENTFNLHFVENPVTTYQRKWKDTEEPTRYREILTNDEIKRVLQELKKRNLRDYIMCYLLADTSMRVDGMANIKLENLNLEKRIIITKDKNRMRKYVFGRHLQAELKKYLIVRARIRSIHYNDTWLFFTQRSTKFKSDTFKTSVFPKLSTLILEMTGKKITAHDFRRSFRTNRINLGQQPGHVDILMNHKTPLSKAYEKPTDKMLVQWFDAFEEL